MGRIFAPIFVHKPPFERVAKRAASQEERKASPSFSSSSTATPLLRPRFDSLARNLHSANSSNPIIVGLGGDDLITSIEVLPPSGVSGGLSTRPNHWVFATINFKFIHFFTFLIARTQNLVHLLLLIRFPLQKVCLKAMSAEVSVLDQCHLKLHSLTSSLFIMLPNGLEFGI